ncbi:MAG: hypothetical protein OXC62_12365 [Aestuariivita sp.]|nr:hypothetical protein [Aestuariivita sp.]
MRTHHVTPIDFDMCSVPNDHSIKILHKVTPLDLLAQVAGLLGDNRRFYFSTNPYHPLMRNTRISA